MTSKLKRDKMMRADPDFLKELNDIKIERIRKGRDKRFKPDRRITKAIRRHRFWPTIKDDIINSELKEEHYD